MTLSTSTPTCWREKLEILRDFIEKTWVAGANIMRSQLRPGGLV